MNVRRTPVTSQLIRIAAKHKHVRRWHAILDTTTAFPTEEITMAPPSTPALSRRHRHVPRRHAWRQSALRPSGPQTADDLVIGIALTTTWMLTTGRRLRCGVPLTHDLNAMELIDFWADDHINHSGITEFREQVTHESHPAVLDRHVA